MSLPLLVDAIAERTAFARLSASLPAAGERRHVGGLHGSVDAPLLVALTRAHPSRLFAVVADTLPDAERWLADLTAVDDTLAVALHPPREGFSEAEPHTEIAGERIDTIERLSRGDLRVILTTGRAVLERTWLPSALRTLREELRVGDVVRLEDLSARLDGMGFERVEMVEDVAQYSVRGGIVDIYSFGMSEPVRVEFWGDDIVELKHFDLSTQRSTRAAQVAVVLPVEGASALPVSVAGTRTSIHSLWSPDTIVVRSYGTALEPEWRRIWDEASHHAELARRRGEDVVPREELFQPAEQAIAALNEFGTLMLGAPDPADVRFRVLQPEPINRDIKRLARLVRDGTATVILCDNEGQAERLEELLGGDAGGPSPASLAIGVLHGGFTLPEEPGARALRVLTDHEIFRRERRLRRPRKYATAAVLEAITALTPGDYVVHLEHGVGIYRGLERIFVRESEVEVAVVEYAGGDRLNVPLYRIDQLERYRSAEGADPDDAPPTLHQIGGKRWAQQRDRTRSAINDMTHELLELHAKRQVARRPPHGPDSAWQRQLESSFLFEDTPDQRRAIDNIKQDLQSERPMDRLLVGDVGYGKTEVAVRAAFKVVQSARQVAVLVPTTILADQHLRTFTERLADFPVRVAMLSRFQTATQQKEILAELAKGTVDIIIGTHRLLSPDVKFAQLGLIIVDEEHRFGVKHKERLKQLKLETDVLTLTATPIPRTLHQSLAGLRDLTLMQTPPRDRSPVLTFIEPWDDGIIEEGIGRELDRGGQVFFVHNRIETIQAMADHVRRVVPRARVGVGHGQLSDRDLEDVMHKFVAGETDVLVSTMIVESGLDVANANTMFVNRADYFGLAQLYQLRGRVGRSHRRAYCYLIVPDNLDEDAERRLKVLEHHTELGAGYRIALKDLEIRGAGNLLGAEQSGFAQAVGFDLYLRMLDEAVRRLTTGEAKPAPQPPDVQLDTPAYLPDDYVTSQDAKLDVYRRLTKVTDPAGIAEVRDELRDRFGRLPAAAEAFFAVATLRIVGGDLGIESILVHGGAGRVTFRETATPRVKVIASAFHDVQFAVDVRRAVPLALKVVPQGAVALLDGLVRALSKLRALA
ncbi:MAG TPA: transcription-repair coupling factor [Gemmatimonadaceae bacterium]|nr:transcription-repair coupling factor [Gemmatimonadaceae bacterium]